MAETRTVRWVMAITVLKMVIGFLLGLGAAVILVILAIGMLLREYRRIESSDD